MLASTASKVSSQRTAIPLTDPDVPATGSKSNACRARVLSSGDTNHQPRCRAPPPACCWQPARETGLAHVGSVGSGFKDSVARDLKKLLDEMPIVKPPVPVNGKGAVHAQPELVAEIEPRAWTNDAKLRDASLKGLRNTADVTKTYYIQRPKNRMEQTSAVQVVRCWPCCPSPASTSQLGPALAGPFLL